MSTFLTVGVTHDHAAIGELEHVAAADAGTLRASALAEGCAEVLVLSTCSRVELHAVLDLPEHDEQAARRACWTAADRLAGLLVAGCPGSVGRVFVATGDDAVRHLFRVAVGLGSRIVGETEVQAQLRSAARCAEAAHGEPHRLRRVVAAAVVAARRTAREHPQLLRRGLLADRAVARALAGHRGDAPAEALVVGAGTMGRQVLERLSGRARTTLLSRRSTARRNGPVVHPLDELPQRLVTADVVFVATSAGRRILTAQAVTQACAGRSGRPLTIVDLSLPRNVDPAVAEVDGVRLLDLDDLGDAGSGVSADAGAVAAAQTVTDAAAEEYCADVRSRRAGPLIGSLRDHLQETCLEQLRRVARGMDLPEEALARMASAVAGAVAHRPSVLARQAAAEDDEAALAMLRAAFGVDGIEDSARPAVA
jgi:glutamyl-tRNA reductase